MSRTLAGSTCHRGRTKRSGRADRGWCFYRLLCRPPRLARTRNSGARAAPTIAAGPTAAMSRRDAKHLNTQPSPNPRTLYERRLAAGRALGLAISRTRERLGRQPCFVSLRVSQVRFGARPAPARCICSTSITWLPLPDRGSQGGLVGGGVLEPVVVDGGQVGGAERLVGHRGPQERVGGCVGYRSSIDKEVDYAGGKSAGISPYSA